MHRRSSLGSNGRGIPASLGKGFTVTEAMTTILALALLSSAAESTNINAYLQTNFRDAAFTTKVVQKNQKELAKINDDFGFAYKFSTVNVRVKEPFKIRIDANVEDTKAWYIVNGPRSQFKVPRIGVNTKTDLTDKPGGRQTVLDSGILTPSLFVDFLDAKFVRMDRATGDAVFDITYNPRYHDKTRYRVWMDPEKKYIAKREWYHRKGRMIATFVYEVPVTENGATFPTKQTIRNGDDVVSGVTVNTAVKLNQGIPDDVFSL